MAKHRKHFGAPNPSPIFDSLKKIIPNHGAPPGRYWNRRVALSKWRKIRLAKRLTNELAEMIDGDMTPPAKPKRKYYPRFVPMPHRNVDKMLRLMFPGHWYERGDLARAAGTAEKTGVYIRDLEAMGAAERTPAPPRHRIGIPRFFYRLTPKGEGLAALCRLLS